MAKECPECGAPLPAGWPKAFCSRCALNGALDLGNSGNQESHPDSTLEARTSQGEVPRFEDYELLEELARGGMGVVYRARQMSLNRIVALKFILSGQLASKQELLRFQSEAETAANLRHPNIVAIYEAGERDGQRYIAMEYVAGRTLTQLVREEGPVPARRAARYLKLVAEAIQYAHEQGILHRDLQPSNVLIDADDQPRITDFGLAKRTANPPLSSDDPQLTVTGQVLGSPGFMPPEQATGSTGEAFSQFADEETPPGVNGPGQPEVEIRRLEARRAQVGPWSDVYGIGAILYYLLTGRPPFQGGTIPDVLTQLRERDPVAPRLLNPNVPPDLETICLKCLEKEPEKRYATARELSEELGHFQRDEPIHARPVSRPEKVWRWCRRKPVLAGLIFGLHLVGVLGLAGIFWQWTRAEDQHTRSEQHLYVANVAEASVALENHNLAGARKFLARIEESPQQRAMRAWEWRYFMGECHSDEEAILGRHEAWVEGVAASADGQWAASIDSVGVAKVWDLASRKEAGQWRAHTDRAEHRPGEFGHAVAFSPEGRALATGGADGWVRLWDANSPYRKLDDLIHFTNAVTGLSFSRDGGLLTALSKGGEVALWALSNDPPALLLTNNVGGFVYSIAFSPDNQTLAIAGVSRPLQLWDISHLPVFRRHSRLEGAIWPIAFALDGESVFASERSEHVVGQWSVATRKEGRHWPEREACFVSLALSPDSCTLASTLTDGEIVIYDLKGEREARTLIGHEDMVPGLAFSGDGRLLVSASYDRTVRLWKPSQVRSVRVIPHGSFARAVRFSPDSRYLATVGLERPTLDEDPDVQQSTLKLWDLKTTKELGSLLIPGNPLTRHIAFSPDDQFLAVDDPGIDDPGARSLGLFRVRPFAWVTNLPGICPTFSADGRSFIYTSKNRILRRGLSTTVNDVDDVVCELSSEIGTLALNPHETVAVCTLQEDEHRALEFWDIRSRRRLGRTATVHENRAHALAFSPDGKLLASASWDGSLAIWDATTQRLIKVLDGQSGHSGELYAVCFSPDGLTIAACGTDATIGLWNVKTLEKIATLTTHAIGADVAFSPDGQWLGGAVYDGTIHLWHAPALQDIKASLPRPKAVP